MIKTKAYKAYGDGLTQLLLKADIEDSIDKGETFCRLDKIAANPEEYNIQTIADALTVGLGIGVEFTKRRREEADRWVEELDASFGLNYQHYITYRLCDPDNEPT